jgi:uncharacterized coiled-coil DUF342 family protein
MKNLSEQELEEIKSVQTKYREYTMQVGELTTRIEDHREVIDGLSREKEVLRKALSELRKEDTALTNRLTEKYGSGKINIETGEITDN